MKHSLDLKINPPIQLLISIGLIYIIAQLLPLSIMLLNYRDLMSSFCLIIGLAFNFSGGISFHSAKTTGDPNKPEKASALVTTGIYQRTRNPMYVGLLFLLLAWNFWLGSLYGLIIIVIFQQYMTHFQIIPEEKALEKLFPKQSQYYFSQVNRWL